MRTAAVLIAVFCFGLKIVTAGFVSMLEFPVSIIATFLFYPAICYFHIVVHGSASQSSSRNRAAALISNTLFVVAFLAQFDWAIDKEDSSAPNEALAGCFYTLLGATTSIITSVFSGQPFPFHYRDISFPLLVDSVNPGSMWICMQVPYIREHLEFFLFFYNKIVFIPEIITWFFMVKFRKATRCMTMLIILSAVGAFVEWLVPALLLYFAGRLVFVSGKKVYSHIVSR